MIARVLRLAPLLLSLALLPALSAADVEQRPAADGTAPGWAHYGGDPGGQRYAPSTALDASNVAGLEAAWTFRTGDVSDGTGAVRGQTSFQATPILVDGLLYVCSPFNKIFALDPGTGKERWRFDPQLDLTGAPANQYICRGVEHWRDAKAAPGAACASRIFTGTNDARLFALDARTGKPCAGFGQDGVVDLNAGVGKQEWAGEYQVTSPPVAVGERVIVGSAVSDNARVDAPSGVVRGYDARTGALAWAWDLAPPDFAPTPATVSDAGWALGTPNVWAPMATDPERDLVFLPTGNAAPDYYRGAERAQMNHYGSSVVALRASTGERVWHFQTVHNDLWDFDVPAQPTLTHVQRNGARVPVVVQATKMGLLFVLHRETGEPIFGVDERPVPQGGAPGEVLSPTQPFPRKPPPLVRHALDPETDAWGLTFWDAGRCRELFQSLRWDGIYTPPTVQGSLMYPGNSGGSNWGGVAVHPERRVLVANVMDIPWVVRLIPRAEFDAVKRAHPGEEITAQRGTPFGMHRAMALSPLELPCNSPPWGKLVAVKLDTGELAWEIPFGTTRDLLPVPIAINLGTPSLGGPLITRSGLVLIGAAMDDYLRAYDLDTGAELWKGRLPAGGQATPMLYEHDGRPYVVIAAGGHARAGTRLGDHLVAFSLPR